MASMRLLTPHQVHLTQATHLFLTTQGTATIEGTALDDDDQTPQARPTRAIWINATTGTDITVHPDPEWMAIHYTLDCTKDDPTLKEWQTRWAAEANRLHEVALDDTLTPQTTEPAGRTPQTHRDPTKHTLRLYPTTIHPEAVTQFKETLGCPTPDDTTHRRTWGTIRRTLHHDIDRDQATWIDQGSVTIRVGGWLNTLSPDKLRRVAGPYIRYPVPHGMDGPCPGLRPGDPPCGHPCPHALFQPLPPQPAPLPGIYVTTITGAKEVYLTTGDSTGQAVSLDQVHHMALGPRLPNADKPRNPLAGRGAREHRPVDPNARGPDRALLHLTMKHTAQLPTTLAGEKYFIVERLTDDVITLAANTLAPPRTRGTSPWATPRRIRTGCRAKKTPCRRTL